MMSEQAALMIDQASASYENKLREFVKNRGDIFVLEDVIALLGIDPDGDSTHYAIPSIVNALRNLGCKTEKLICFIPPSRVPANKA